MRGVTIDLARGSDTSVDPRVAPNGTIARSENVRLDKMGRLVQRAGYTSLGTTVQMAGVALTPHDLHEVDGTLVALGNVNNALQPGIRSAFRYMGASAQGVWRKEVGGRDVQGALDTTGAAWDLPAADNMHIILSELGNTMLIAGTTLEPDANTCDVAITSDNAFVCMVSVSYGSFGSQTRVTVVDAATGLVVVSTPSSAVFETNPRVLAIGQVFYVFSQGGTSINCRTLNMASANPTFGGATLVSLVATTEPGPYDVAPYTGTNDFLIVHATATGYTVRRLTSAFALVGSANVATAADQPVSVCGSSPGNVSVLTTRSPTGANWRSHNPTTLAVVLGPTDIDVIAATIAWVAVQQLSATQVYCIAQGVQAGSQLVISSIGVVATGAFTSQNVHGGVRPVTKPLIVDGRPFVWESLGLATPAPYGLTSYAISAAFEQRLAGVALDGLAKVAFSAKTAHQIASVVRGSGATYYVGLIAKDPRDGSYKANLLSFELFGGKRRQGVSRGGSLFLAGGNAAQYDKRTIGEIGFETAPLIITAAPAVSGSGAMTLLGVYTYSAIFRVVSANGQATLSAPSPPVVVTLGGAANSVQLTIQRPFSLWLYGINLLQGVKLSIDVYRTEAGGSIPRLCFSFSIGGSATTFGGQQSVFDLNADSVVQAGSPMYTQGADGSVSGRLPLGLASPCSLIAESDGKLILAGLERDTQLHLSAESRPGEAPGFINDDLFFVQNPEAITAIVAGEDGRRFIFGRSNIRELIGQGPNAAGVGDIAEPVEIDSRVGAVDWRSVVKTELGIMFQGSATASRPSLYLLPRGGSAAIDIGKGIEDVLKLFPVITSATRHDEEQLVTFTLQNTAGDDGRIIHLDMRNAGMGKSGWQGRWFVDRVSQLELEQAPYIVEEYSVNIPAVMGTAQPTIPLELPRGMRVGDRLIIIGTSGGAIFALTGTTLLLNQATTTGVIKAFELLITTPALAVATSLTLSFAGAINGQIGSVLVLRVFLIRGAHASAPAEMAIGSYVNSAAPASAILTPSWGAANNLWLAACFVEVAPAFNSIVPSLLVSNNLAVHRVEPAGYGHVELVMGSSGTLTTGVSGDFTASLGTASRQLRAASQGPLTWTLSSAAVSATMAIAIRPLAAPGTPIRASVQHDGRLVVCNSTDVLFSDPSAISDQGGAQIEPYIEVADIYPMGIGGAGRHLGITFVGELLGICALTALCSYDNGRNWTALRTYRLSPANGWQIGQTVRVNWTPKRRKIEGVRVRFVVSREDFVAVPAGPLTQGLAFNQAVLWFEDLAGPSRVDYKRTQ